MRVMNTEQNYLSDVLSMLIERGRTAKARAADERKAGRSGDFDAGRTQGYYETLSTMLNQLDAFGIERRLVGLPEDLNLERELL
jgi:hypothetical protein